MKKCGDDRAKGIAETFRICIGQNILKEYLEENRAEVEKIMLTMVSPEYLREAEERTERIRGAVEGFRGIGVSEEIAINQLIRQFNITPEYARNCFNAEWEPDDTYEDLGRMPV